MERKLTLSREHFDVNGTLHSNLLTNLQRTQTDEQTETGTSTAVRLQTHLREDLRRDVGLGVEEVQHVAGVLDAVLGRLLRGGEAVVPGAVEVFEAAGSVFQLVALTGNDGLLFGNAAGRRTDLHLKTSPVAHCRLSSQFCHLCGRFRR